MMTTELAFHEAGHAVVARALKDWTHIPYVPPVMSEPATITVRLAPSASEGDRMTRLFAVPREPPVGTNAKCRLHRTMSEFEGKAENICSH